eukprot:TRINITY_DN15216_c0_g1_i2.p1 TRINITY_DN15216_c0_g1~~TRINITY_DN15216_c0_g1_i2.p1  ORF type:complete len:149 (+),score=7.27 TRINITY_DN15216_c0_g1_i2:306-752(+)
MYCYSVHAERPHELRGTHCLVASHLFRHASPRTVFGTSPRDCSKNLQTGDEKLRSKSPGAEGKRQLSSGALKSSTFCNAPRDTGEFLICKQEGSIKSSQTPARKERTCGGFIGSAARFRSESPSASYLQRTPGPQSYRPSPCYSSTFR